MVRGKAKGIVTLTMLIMLSSMLVILLLLDDDILNSYGFINSSHHKYVNSHQVLQQKINTMAQVKCQSLPLTGSKNIHQLFFQKDLSNKEVIVESIWCKRYSLFKQKPNQAYYQNELSQYINLSLMDYFRDKLSSFTYRPYDHSQKLIYFFPESIHRWTINGDYHAIILAEGDLSIEGQGTIYGSVFSTNLQLSPTVHLEYQANVVNSLVEKYRFWKRVKGSWYDSNK